MMDFFSKFNWRIFADKDKGKWYPKAERDWKIIFFTIFFLTVFAVTAHIALYVYVFTNETFFGGMKKATSTPSVLNEQKLKIVISSFAAKKERADALIRTPLQISDPSRAPLGIPDKNPISPPPPQGKANGLIISQ